MNEGIRVRARCCRTSSYKKRKKQQRPVSSHAHTERRPRKDTVVTRWPSTSQEAKSHQTPTLKKPSMWTFSMQKSKKINFW